MSRERSARDLSAWVLAALCLSPMLAGCARPSGKRSTASATPTGPASTLSPPPRAAASAARNELGEPFPRLPSLLAGPFQVEGGAAEGGCARPTTYAFYGDPETRVLDGVWRATKTDCAPTRLTPVGLLPSAAVLVEAFVHEGGIYAVLESVATRGQPAGLRTVVDVIDPRPSGIVPPATREALLPMLPPPHALDAAVFHHDELGGATPPPARGKGAQVPPSAVWVAPPGLAIEDVFQSHFRREVGRVRQGDPVLGVIARALRADPTACLSSAWSQAKVSVCWSPLLRYDHAAFARAATPGMAPQARAVGHAVRPETILGVPGRALSPEEHLAAVRAVANRQPLRGTVIAAGPAHADGGSVGVVAVTEPSPALYLLRVDGPLVSLTQPDVLGDLSSKDLLAATRIEAEILPSSGAGSRVLVRMDRGQRPPWTALFQTTHPFRESLVPSFGRDPVEDERFTFRFLRAKTFAEARAFVLAPPLHATPAELAELFDGMSDPAHRRAHAARDAVWVRAPSTGTPIDPALAPLEEMDKVTVQRLIALSKTDSIRTPSPGGDDQKRHDARTGPTGPVIVELEVWLVREDGKLKLSAVVTH